MLNAIIKHLSNQEDLWSLKFPTHTGEQAVSLWSRQCAHSRVLPRQDCRGMHRTSLLQTLLKAVWGKPSGAFHPSGPLGLQVLFPFCTRTEAFLLLHGSLALVTWSWNHISTTRRNLTACCSHALLNQMSVPTHGTKLKEVIKGQRDVLLIGTTVKLHFSILGNNKGLQLLKVGQDFGCMPHAGIRKHRHWAAVTS